MSAHGQWVLIFTCCAITALAFGYWLVGQLVGPYYDAGVGSELQPPSEDDQ